MWRRTSSATRRHVTTSPESDPYQYGDADPNYSYSALKPWLKRALCACAVPRATARSSRALLIRDAASEAAAERVRDQLGKPEELQCIEGERHA